MAGERPPGGSCRQMGWADLANLRCVPEELRRRNYANLRCVPEGLRNLTQRCGGMTVTRQWPAPPHTLQYRRQRATSSGNPNDR